MSEEMRLHLEQRTRENVAAGMSPEDAHYAALRKFGGVEQAKERAREQRGSRWLDELGQDFRYGVRTLRKNPGFATVAVLTLALGIGANTAIFTLTNALLLRPLPVSEPTQLILARKSPGDASFSYPAYARYRDQIHSLAGLAAVQNYVTRRWLVASDFGGSEPEPVQAQVVSGNFFAVLGVPAALGRTLTPDDDRPGQPQPVVVLSHGYWQRRFGGDPAVVGKTVRLGSAASTIVGVMPAGFTGFFVGVEPELWWPMQMDSLVDPVRDGASPRLAAEGSEWLVMVGRLKAGVSRAAARAEWQAIFQQELADFAATRAARWTDTQRRDHFARTLELDEAATGYSYVRKRFAQPLVILMVIAGAVLLIACANVAGLLLARGAARQREFAVRAALGAGRRRLIRQLVTESLLLALLGGALGLLLAHWGTAFLATYLPVEGGALDLAPDGRVLCFALLASVLTGILFGVIPALRGSRIDLAEAMKRGSGQAGSSRSRFNHALVVTQLALSVTLLAGAGLFGRTLRNLRSADLGFQREHVTLFSLESAQAYDANQRAELYRRLLASLEAYPDVRSATMAAAGLMSGESLGTQFRLDGYTPAPDEEMRVQFNIVGPRFFETLGIPLLRGREQNAVEAAGSASVGAMKKVVIGEAMARRFFGDADPIGRIIRHNLRNSIPLEIIGVAKDAKYRAVREKTPLEYYVPYGAGLMDSPMTFYVRTTGNAAPLKQSLRAIVARIDPKLNVSGVRTLEEVVDGTLVQERVIAQLAGFFSGFALLLASLGLYGALAYGVARRTREIGVRMALGASVREVIGLVVRQGVGLALLGCVAGLAGALALTRWVAGLLYGVEADDPLTFATTAGVLVLVALAASWLPARRAAKVDPMVALRSE